MLRLLKYLIYGHIHEWEILQEVPLNIVKTNIVGEETVVSKGTLYTLVCKKCGEMKTFRNV